MTLSTTANRISYSGNDSTTGFSFPYLFFADADLTVILVVDSTGVETTQTITTHYTVADAGEVAGGTVNMVTAPATGETLVIIRTEQFTQGLDLVENDPFPSASVEQQFDILTMLTQQLDDRIDRSFVLSDGDTTGVSLTLPAPVALKTFRWNAGLTALEQTDDPAVSATAAAASAAAALVSEGLADADATATAADAVLTAADAVSTAADVVSAANSAASAAASAQGFSGVTLLTASSNDVETTDARSYYQVDASSNTVSVNLPSIGTGNDGLSYTIEVLDVSNAITLVRDGSDTINGVAGNYTGLVEVGQVIQIIADDGTPDNWIVVQASALKVDDSTVELSGRTIRVKDDGITPAKVAGSVNAQTGTTYTTVIGDAFKTVTMSNASANTLTIPTNASVAYSTGDRIDVIMIGAGVTTVTGDTGVTVNGVSAGSGALAQYGACSLLKIGTDTWLCVGLDIT